MSSICVDIGSSSVKCTHLTGFLEHQRSAASASCPNGMLADGSFDVSSVLAAVDCAVSTVLKNISPCGINHVSLTCFATAIIGARKSTDGQWNSLTPVLSYATKKQSVYAAVKTLEALLSSDAYHDRTGAPIHAAYAPAQIEASRHVGIFNQGVVWCSLTTFLLCKWTGLSPLDIGVSTSEAAWSGMLNGELRSGPVGWSWDSEVLRVLSIVDGGERRGDTVPPIRPGNTCIHVRWDATSVSGSGAAATPCSAPTTITVPATQAVGLAALLGCHVDERTGVRLWLGLGDGAGAAVGSGCLPCLPTPAASLSTTCPPARMTAVIALTIGTSAALRTVITGRQADALLCRGRCADLQHSYVQDQSQIDFRCLRCKKLRLSKLGLWAYPFTDIDIQGLNGGQEPSQGGFVLIGGALTDGGSLMDYFRTAFGLSPPVPEANLCRPALPSRLTCLPFLSGERSTGWQGAARGTFCGVDGSTSAADLQRGAMDGVAFRLRIILDRLRLLLGADTRVRIVCSGGSLSASPVWCSILSHALEEAVHVPTGGRVDQEATTLGAFHLARLHWASHPDCPEEGRAAAVESAMALSRNAQAPDETLQTLESNSASRWTVYRPSVEEGVRAAWRTAQARHTALYNALQPLHELLLP